MAQASSTFRTSSGRQGWRGVALSTRKATLALELVLGVTAVGGGIGVAGSPSGDTFSFSLDYLDGSPFVNYLLPGLWLLCFAGLGSLGAFWKTLGRSPVAAYAGAFAGFSMAVFEAVQVAIVPFHFLQVLYFIAGASLIALAFRLERDAAEARRIALRAVSLLNWRSAAAAFAALIAIYVVVLQPWLTNVGSTAAERAAAMPGDELKSDTTWQTTRSITIKAPPDVVWSWLIQHGRTAPDSTATTGWRTCWAPTSTTPTSYAPSGSCGRSATRYRCTVKPATPTSACPSFMSRKYAPTSFC